MKIFLATEALEDVRWATERGLIDGVVLPDDALAGSSSPSDSEKWLGTFCRAVALPVFVALGAEASHDLRGAARELGRSADNVVIQLPFSDETVGVMHQLADEGVQVAATFVGSAMQAMLAAKAGASHVLLDVDRIDAAGGNSAQTIEHACVLLERMGSETDIVALFPSPGATFVSCATAGADAAVVGTSALRALLAYPFTTQSLVDSQRRPTNGGRLRVNHS